jgi:hypothetical protein
MVENFGGGCYGGELRRRFAKLLGRSGWERRGAAARV